MSRSAKVIPDLPDSVVKALSSQQGLDNAMDNTLTCTSCGLDKTESIVHGGSYILRCAACGEAIVATSFMAMLDSEYDWAAFIDAGPGKVPRPEALVARGRLQQISAAIKAAARDGNPIRLILETKD